MTRWLAALVLVLSAWGSAAPAAPPPEPGKASVNPLAKWAPADSLFFVVFDGDNSAFRGTALAAILAEPEVKAVLAGPIQQFNEILGQEMLKKGGLDPKALLPLLKTKFGFATSGFAPPAEEGGDPRLEALVVIQTGKPDSPEAKAVRLLLDQLLEKAGQPPDAFKETQVAGLRAFTATIDRNQFTHLTTQGHFLMGLNGGLQKALDKNRTKLSATKEFQRISRITGGSEILLVHHEHGKFMRGMGQLLMPPPVRDALTNQQYGLANIESATFSFSPAGKGLKTSAFVRTAGGPTGLLELMAGKPIDPGLVKLAPKDAEFFFGMSLEAGRLWDVIVALAASTPQAQREYEQAMEKARQTLGFDLRRDFIASLGDEAAGFGPSPTMAIKLTRPAKFRACLQAMVTKLGQQAATAGGPMKEAWLGLRNMTWHERTLTYVDGDHVPLFVQPCYTMVGDYAVFAITPAALKEYLLRMQGGETLADNPDFQAVRTRLAPGASSIYYADTRSFLEAVYGLMPLFLGGAKMIPDDPEEARKVRSLLPDPARLPAKSVISKHLFGCVAAHRALPDGVLWECYSPVGLPTPPALKQGGGLLTMSVLAGMLLPAAGRARQAAERARALNEQRMKELEELEDAEELNRMEPAADALWEGVMNAEFKEPAAPAPGEEPRAAPAEHKKLSQNRGTAFQAVGTHGQDARATPGSAF
ncbi:MAG: DUF3352 domain-containing protein [Planctomycetota bacterium]